MDKEQIKYFEMDCGCKFPIIGEEKKSDGFPKTELDFYNLNLECEKTWDLLRSGDTLGVFQLDTGTGQKWAEKVKPDNIEELSALSALLRPGAAEAMLDGISMSEHYVLRKFLKEENVAKFPALNKILSRTYNVLLYQEQIIEIGKEIAGFNLVEADSIRKAVSDKKAEALKKVGVLFVDRAEKLGVVSRKEAEEIFEWIKSSARYLFSVNHAISYSLPGYCTAYAKAHFPKRFGQAYMTYASDGPLKKKREVIKDVIQDGKKQGYFVKPPSLLNLFKSEGKDCMIDGEVYYGLANIKGVGGAALKKLKEVVQDFKPVEEITWDDVVFFLSTKVNKTAVESLVKSGSLSHLKISRKRGLFHLNKFNSLTKSVKDKCIIEYLNGGDLIEVLTRVIYKLKQIKNKDGSVKSEKTIIKTEETLDSLLNPPYNLDNDLSFNMSNERELLGICLTVNIKDVIDTSLCNCNCAGAKATSFDKMVIPCTIQNSRYFKIKNGNNKGKSMCSLTFSDDFGSVDAVIWSDVLEECENVIFEGNTVIVFCDPSNRKGQVKVTRLCQA